MFGSDLFEAKLTAAHDIAAPCCNRTCNYRGVASSPLLGRYPFNKFNYIKASLGNQFIDALL